MPAVTDRFDMPVIGSAAAANHALRRSLLSGSE